MLPSGCTGLPGHGAHVEFRNIRIRDLFSGDTARATRAALTVKENGQPGLLACCIQAVFLR
jgi:hypothetical protein